MEHYTFVRLYFHMVVTYCCTVQYLYAQPFLDERYINDILCMHI